VLVTRPQPGASATAKRLAERGHEPVLLPLSDIRPLPVELPPAGVVDAVAVTSANALRALPPLPEALARRPCYAVGGSTARAARAAGFLTVAVAAGDGAALAALIAAREPAGSRILYPCGRVRRPTFERGLAEGGFACRALEVYDTVFLDPNPDLLAAAADGAPIDAVLVYSAETARRLAQFAAAREPDGPLSRAAFLCLSPHVAAALGTLGGGRTYVPDEPSEDALLTLLSAA
jgi:uroporphyrinogen-III synthase